MSSDNKRALILGFNNLPTLSSILKQIGIEKSEITYCDDASKGLGELRENPSQYQIIFLNSFINPGLDPDLFPKIREYFNNGEFDRTDYYGDVSVTAVKCIRQLEPNVPIYVPALFLDADKKEEFLKKGAFVFNNSAEIIEKESLRTASKSI
jgi:hypothetical protein